MELLDKKDNREKQFLVLPEKLAQMGLLGSQGKRESWGNLDQEG